MTHDQDPNLTGAGADPISGPHSGRLYQSDGHGPEFSLSEIQGVAAGFLRERASKILHHRL